MCVILLNFIKYDDRYDICRYMCIYICMHVCSPVHAYMNAHFSIYLWHKHMADGILSLVVSSHTFHSAAFHGARRKRKLIRSLSMFIISLQFSLNPLFLFISVLSTSEHRSCSTIYLDTPNTVPVTSGRYKINNNNNTSSD